MNKINFTKTNTYTRSNKKPWARKGSLALCLFILVAITSLQMIQWKTLRNVKQEKELHLQHIVSLDQIVKEKNQLAEEQSSLQKEIQKLKRAKKPDLFLALFDSITEYLGANSLESLHIFGKDLELTIGSSNIKTANQFMENIANLPSINSLNLISIRPNANNLFFKIKAKLV